MSRPAVTLALALSLALTGCAGTDQKAGGKPRASTPAAASSTPAGSSEGGAAAALPEGYTWEAVEDAALEFAVPAQWSAINPKKLLADGDSSAFDDMAKKMGVTPKQMMQAMGNAELILMAAPKNSYADNISGLIVPLDGIPTEAQLKGQISALSETDVVVTAGTSPVGNMIAADYALKVGTNMVHGRTLFFQGDNAVLNLSVSTLDAKDTAEISEVIRTSIHEL